MDGQYREAALDEAAIRSSRCSQPAAVNGPWILAATILGSSMAFIDGTVVNVALPALQSALHASLSDVSVLRSLRPHPSGAAVPVRSQIGIGTLKSETFGRPCSSLGRTL